MASTSTSLFPQSSTATNTNNTHNYSEQNGMMSIFTLNGSPPLVAAFLGIGLFTVAMTVVFAWRRIGRGRLLVQPVRPAARTAKKAIVLGEKPALWDVWTRREEKEGDEEGGLTIEKWENITPFSATLFCPIEPEPGPASTARNTRRSSSAAMMSIRQYLRPTPPLPPVPSPPPQELQAYELEEMNARSRSRSFVLTEGSSIAMSFTIAMPFPRKAVESDTSDQASMPDSELKFHDLELGEYCIGSMEVPCSEDG